MADDPVARKQELYTNWQLQEGLLQAYRGLFVTSESVIIALAAAMVPQKVPFLALFGLGLALIVFWRSICRSRADAVTYFQQRIVDLESESKGGVFSSFKHWQDAQGGLSGVPRDVGWSLLELFGVRKHETSVAEVTSGSDAPHSSPLVHESKTRRIMELYLPRLFLIAWGVMIVLGQWQHWHW